MAKKPTKPQPAAPEPGGVKPISYKPSRAINAGLAEYRGQTEFPPSKSAIIERALREFLTARGIVVAPGGDD